MGVRAAFDAAKWRAQWHASEANVCFFYGLIKGPSVK